MARHVRSSKIETRTQRLKLAVDSAPYFARIGRGLAIGYRRNQTAGTWLVRAADGKGGNWTRSFATADDFEEADGERVLDFWGAQDRARQLARGKDNADDDTKPVTVAQALDHYAADLKARGGLVYNAERVRFHLSPALLGRPVSLLTVRELRRWRDALAAKVAPGTVNRTRAAFAAALELAATQNPARITNRENWRVGLKGLPNADQPRDAVMPDGTIRRLVAAAYEESHELGLLVEVLAVTGTRISQAVRLTVADLQADRSDPRLLMPCSRKGRGRKVERRPVPISASLAMLLKQAAAGRSAGAPLLVKPDGSAWNTQRSEHRVPFMRAVKRAGLDPKIMTYVFRHSSIVRQLLAGTPVRIVAHAHDTGVAMLEKTYSRFIGDHADVLMRRALLDVARPALDNVKSFHGKK
jgi:integrase